MSKFNKKINLNCSNCGNKEFKIVDENIKDLENASENTQIECDNCGEIFTKAELIKINTDKSNEGFNELIKEFQENIKKEFKN